jgi:hypothetical protein
MAEAYPGATSKGRCSVRTRLTLVATLVLAALPTLPTAALAAHDGEPGHHGSGGHGSPVDHGSSGSGSGGYLTQAEAGQAARAEAGPVMTM